MTTKVIRTDEIKVGDFILDHGAIFKINNVINKGSVIYFDTQVEKYAKKTGAINDFPISWQNRWTLQGAPFVQRVLVTSLV